jgi:hypothetical protein
MNGKRRSALQFLLSWCAATALVCAGQWACASEMPKAEMEQWRLASLWPSNQPQSPQTPLPAVVRVIAVDGNLALGNGTMMSMGSGTLVDTNDDYGLVITNWHVVRDAVGPVEVVFPGGFHSMARVVRTDKEWDLAALLIWKPPGISPVPVTNIAPKPGEMLTIAGYGKGDYKMQSGPCTEYLAPRPGRPAEIVELAAAARHGDSGGPILNTRGELAGVLFGEGGGHTDGSYGGRVQKFLELTALDLRSLPAGSTGGPGTAVATNPAKANGANVTAAAARFDGGIHTPQNDPRTQADWNSWESQRLASRPSDASGLNPSNNSAARPLDLAAESDSKSAAPSAPAAHRAGRFVWQDELKTFMAAFGVAAILLHVMRFAAS